MPRSRSRKKRPDRRPRPTLVPDSLILADILAVVDGVVDGDEPDHAPMFPDLFDRAAWSFHSGPGPWYTVAGSAARDRAWLRAREWFLFEFELPSGITPAEEWALEHEDEPGGRALRRALNRFLQSECGVFEVEEARDDGWLRLRPVLGGKVIRARPIEDGKEMLPSGHASGSPGVEAGDVLATRLYWLDDGRAELSAGTDRISNEAKNNLLADPPEADALRSALVIESLFGANPARLLSLAGGADFPRQVHDLLSALSDGTFGYRRLWRELEGEADPVAVTRQLLRDLDEWTFVEQELLVYGVAGAWLRKREAAAGRALTSETVERERRQLEEHVSTVLDVPERLELPSAPRSLRLAMAPDEAERIADLPTEPLEWVVDIRADDWARHRRIGATALPFPLACAIVESAITAFDDLGDEDELERDADDEGYEEEDLPGEADVDEDLRLDADEESDEDADLLDEDDLGELNEEGPRLIQLVPLVAGEDEAAVVLRAVVEGLLAGNEDLPRPQRIVFRQRTLAARLRHTLQEAGLAVVLRYFTEVVDTAAIDVETDEEKGEALLGGETPTVGQEAGGAEVLSDEERVSCERLSKAVERGRQGLESLSAAMRQPYRSAVTITPAEPLTFSYAGLEGEDDRVVTFGLVPRQGLDGLSIDIFFNPPDTASALEAMARERDTASDDTDRVWIDLREDGEQAADAKVAGWPCPERGVCVLGFRMRPDNPVRFLRGRELALVAAIMEAVAVVAEQAENDIGWEESQAAEVSVPPLGDVKVEWQAPWPRETDGASL